MRGTIVCGVTDEHDPGALELAAMLSARLGLRLILAYVAGPAGDRSPGPMKGREAASRLLAQLTSEYGLQGSVERREATGDRADMLARIAAEEGADLIVVGESRPRRFRRRLRDTLAAELESQTPVPVVIAPPQRGERPP